MKYTETVYELIAQLFRLCYQFDRFTPSKLIMSDYTVSLAVLTK